MRDSGSIVIGWLTKLALVLVVLGLLAYDGVAVLVANYSASDRAAHAAHAAADNMSRTGSVQKAYEAAARAASTDATVETNTFRVGARGQVELFVRREVKTLWLHHVGPLREWTQARQSGVARPGA